MCNVSGILFGARNLAREEVAGKRVLEVGAYDINGSLRSLLASWGPCEYLGVDLCEGPGVDRVCSVTQLVEQLGAEAFDVVLSTEMLEHVRDWRAAVSNLKNVCRPGGILLCTTRSPGYPYHEAPGDYWRFSHDDMAAIFEDFEILSLESDPASPGIFLKARKPERFKEKDLQDFALYNIVVGEVVRTLADGDLRTLRALRLSVIAKAKAFLETKAKRFFHAP